MRQLFRQLLCVGICSLVYCAGTAQTIIKVVIDTGKTYQTIENFAASDAWACQFVGNWPDAKKNAIADLLFSTDTLRDGSQGSKHTSGHCRY